MKNFILNNDQVNELRVAHRAERNRRAAYKVNAVILLGAGWKLKNVKQALLLDDETLRSYVEKYKIGGIEALLHHHYSGRQTNLDDKQLKLLRAELDNHIYLTTSAIIEFVFDQLSVNYTLSGMRDLLHREGYAYKKPKLVPGNPGPQAQEDFVHYYEKFMETKDNIDAVHTKYNTMAGYGWIKKGEQRKLKTNSGR